MLLSSEKLVLNELIGNPVGVLNEVFVNATVKGEQPLFWSVDYPAIGLFTTFTCFVSVAVHPTLFKTNKEIV